MSYTASAEDLRDQVARRLDKITQHAEDLVNDDTANRQLILEDMIHRLGVLTDELDRVATNEPHRYNYPMPGEESEPLNPGGMNPDGSIDGMR